MFIKSLLTWSKFQRIQVVNCLYSSRTMTVCCRREKSGFSGDWECAGLEPHTQRNRAPNKASSLLPANYMYFKQRNGKFSNPIEKRMALF